MEDAISSGSLESLGGGVHSLSGGCKGTRGQRLYMLCVANFGAGVDNFLSSFEEFLGELSELKKLPFDERVA
jgi:hypothetical protein